MRKLASFTRVMVLQKHYNLYGNDSMKKFCAIIADRAMTFWEIIKQKLIKRSQVQL